MVVHTDCNALSSLHSLKNWGHDPVKVKKQQDGEANGGAAPPAKKDGKKSLKGVLVKKKSKPVAIINAVVSKSMAKDDKAQAGQTAKSSEKSDGDEREVKRRKVSAG